LFVVGSLFRRLGENVESADNKVATIGVALGQIGPQLGEMAGLSKELLSTTAKTTAGLYKFNPVDLRLERRLPSTLVTFS
jgi:hypothetical protein